MKNIKEKILLAIFMGWFQEKGDEDRLVFYKIEEKAKYVAAYLDYNRRHEYNFWKPESDWNHLQQLVERIESLEEDEFGLGRFTTYISNKQGHYCDIRERECNDTKIADGWGKTKFEAVYNAVKDFVQYYNEQNKQS